MQMMDFLNIPKNNQLLHLYSEATHLGIYAFDDEVDQLIEIVQNKARDQLCKPISSLQTGRLACDDSIKKAGRMASKIGQPYLSRCHMGFVFISVPVIDRKDYLGCVCAGPFFLWERDEIVKNELLSQASRLHLDETDLMQRCECVPTLNAAWAKACADFLFSVVESTMKSGLEILNQRREIQKQQQRIASQIQEKKSKDHARKWLENLSPKEYPLHMERAISDRVSSGDYAGAKELINDWLGDIFFGSAGNFEVIRARVLELVVILSRAAVEGGAGLDTLLGLNLNFVAELGQIKKFEDLCDWLIQVLDRIMQPLISSSDIKNARNISSAMAYIRDHSSQKISLESVAQATNISPHYLSHLFSAETGMTFTEYLTDVRLQKARHLLSTTSLTSAEIAMQVGYDDPGYFTRIFRKHYLMPPQTWRIQNKQSKLIPQ